MRRPSCPASARTTRTSTTCCCPTAPGATRCSRRSAERGVHAVFHYVPLHSSPGGRRYGRADGGLLAVTDGVGGRLCACPLWAGMERGRRRSRRRGDPCRGRRPVAARVRTHDAPSRPARTTVTPRQYRQVAELALVFLTLIVFTGAAVRLSGSGLGCPDWPKCYGKVAPPLETHAVIEFGNRMLSGLVGLVAAAAGAARVPAPARSGATSR